MKYKKLFIVGLPGVGKTSLGRFLGAKYNLQFYDTDLLITEKLKMSVSEIFESLGHYQYRVLEKAVLLDLISKNQYCVIATGGGLPCYFDNMSLMQQAGQSVWLQDDLSVIVARLEQQRRPLMAKIPPHQIRNWLVELLSARQYYYRQADVFAINNTIEELTRPFFAENNITLYEHHSNIL
jgi:shikimate kinase